MAKARRCVAEAFSSLRLIALSYHASILRANSESGNVSLHHLLNILIRRRCTAELLQRHKLKTTLCSQRDTSWIAADMNRAKQTQTQTQTKTHVRIPTYRLVHYGLAAEEPASCW